MLLAYFPVKDAALRLKEAEAALLLLVAAALAVAAALLLAARLALLAALLLALAVLAAVLDTTGLGHLYLLRRFFYLTDGAKS
jgi:hypothetical protein